MVAKYHIHGLVQVRRNSIANALELRLSCTNPSIWNDIIVGIMAYPLIRPINQCWFIIPERTGPHGEYLKILFKKYQQTVYAIVGNFNKKT